jgi:hypothetical protein
MTRPSPFRAALVLGALALFAGSAAAEERRCTGTIGPVALDNIFVPDGASCTLNRTRANGSVVVGTGARLVASGVTINGNVQAEGAASVSIGGRSVIGGSVQLMQGYAASVSGARISGDLQLDENSGPLLAGSNVIGGNLQAVANRGGLQISNNQIKGNLQCKENSPPPTGGGNRAASKEDQCERL